MSNNELTNKRKFRLPINTREIGILYALIVLWVVLIFTVEQFSFFGNSAVAVKTFMSILKSAALVGSCGVGMTYAIAAGMLDLSVGKMMALLAVININLANVIGWWCVPITLVCGAILGAVNGTLTAKLKLPAFIATLSTFYIFQFFARLASNDLPVYCKEDWFSDIAHAKIGEFPVAFIVLIALALIGTWILRRTTLGRKIIAIGNSEKASFISGVNIDNTIIAMFMLVGLFTATSAVLHSAYLTSAEYSIVDGFEFTVITAVVLGGTAMAGGKGSVFTTIVAAIFLSTLTVAMDKLLIGPKEQQVVRGFILLFAFSISTIRDLIADYSRKRKSRQQLAQKLNEA